MYQKLIFITLLSLFNFYSSQQYIWNSQGTTVAGGNGYGANMNQLWTPMGVRITAANDLYISDTGNRRIQLWAYNSASGVTTAGGNGGGSNLNQIFPSGLFVETDGTQYIVDVINSRVLKWGANDTQGTVVAGGNGKGNSLSQLNFPGGIFKKGSDLYIVDSGNFRVLRWTLGDSSGTVVAGGNDYGTGLNQLGTPAFNGSVYVDNSDNIYVSEYSNNRVLKWSPGADHGVVVAGSDGQNTLTNPTGFTVLPDGTLLIAEYGNNSRISMWKNNVFLGTVAGGNGLGNLADQLSKPSDVTIDSDYNLYVSDYSNNRIQKFSFSGTLSSIEIPKVKSQIYPNPLNDVLNISSENQIQRIKIYDASGREVITKEIGSKDIKINVEELHSGVYFLEIVGKSGKESLRLIKK